MRKMKLETGEYYHIFNRGANKADIFFDDNDRARFIWILNMFNDLNADFASVRLKEDPRTNLGAKLLEKVLLVDILCYVLMSNHFHLLLRQREEGGISKFMHKLGTSHTNYMNLKHERSGALFQGPFKAVKIESDEQLLHLSRYIHLNPLELHEPHWKNSGLKNKRSARRFIRNYNWSSYPFFIGIDKHEKLISNGNLIFKLIKKNKYEQYMEDWFDKIEYDVVCSNLGAKLLD